MGFSGLAENGATSPSCAEILHGQLTGLVRARTITVFAAINVSN
jgi:hypothetical protein